MGASIRDSQSEERAHALHALDLSFVKEFDLAVSESDFIIIATEASFGSHAVKKISKQRHASDRN